MCMCMCMCMCTCVCANLEAVVATEVKKTKRIERQQFLKRNILDFVVPTVVQQCGKPVAHSKMTLISNMNPAQQIDRSDTKTNLNIATLCKALNSP